MLNSVLRRRTATTPWSTSSATPPAFKPLVIAELIWKDCGWGTIIFLAALTQVDDAALRGRRDRRRRPWRRFWHVTLPSIRPIIVLLLILRLGDILSVGFEQMLLQRDTFGPDAAEVIDTFVYYHGVVGGDYGYAAAAGLFKGLVAPVLVFAANKVAHRLGEQGVYRCAAPRLEPCVRARIGRPKPAVERRSRAPSDRLVVAGPAGSRAVLARARPPRSSDAEVIANGGWVAVAGQARPCRLPRRLRRRHRRPRAVGLRRVTVVGTAASLACTIVLAYALSRPRRLRRQADPAG